MLNVKKTLTKILDALKVDYVVEEGTSGIWTYRKWNSGVAECWGETASASRAITSSYGYGYYSARETHSFPTDLFTSAPSAQATLKDGGASGNWFCIDSITISAVSGYCYGIKSNTSTCSVNICAKGTWK